MLWYCVQCCFVTNIVYRYVIYLLKAHIILEVAVEILMLDNLLPSTVIFLKFCTNFADTVVGIFIIISREIFMLSYVKHIKKMQLLVIWDLLAGYISCSADVL